MNFNFGLQPSKENSAAPSPGCNSHRSRTLAKLASTIPSSHRPTIIVSRKLLLPATIASAHCDGTSLPESTSCGRDRGDRSCAYSVAKANETSRNSYRIGLLPAMAVPRAETRGGGAHRESSMPVYGWELVKRATGFSGDRALCKSMPGYPGRDVG